MLALPEIRKRLGVGRLDAHNVRRLLQFAEARGEAGRWPEQNFEHDASWTDGWLIDRTAMIAGVDTGAVFQLYCDAHAQGLKQWRKVTN